MKNSQFNLLKLAYKFGNKYAQTQTLQQIIENAASYGEKSDNGIINFPAQLKKDQADLTLIVTISSGIMGGKTVIVSRPIITPESHSMNYAKVSDQIKKYLDKHLSSFPQIEEGTMTLEFSGKGSDSEVAGR